MIRNREAFRTLIIGHKFLKKPKKNTGRKLSVERTQETTRHSEYMKRFWKKKEVRAIKPSDD